MNIEKLFSKTTTINVSVVKVDNKKLTKTIFNQVNILSPFDNLYNLREGVQFLGYVNDKGKWIIWSDSNRLFKYELKKITPIIYLDLNRNKINDLIEIYPSELVKQLYHYIDEEYHETYRDNQISTVLDLKEQYAILEKQELVRGIFDNILSRQIFL